MAINEGARMDSQFIVVSLVPDVCKSPGAPVPYPIVGYLDQSILVSPNVRAKGMPVFHMGSRVATVVGDEAGVGGGIKSGVCKGMCRPVVPVPTVNVNGHQHTHHQNTLFEMNCAGPDGSGNTIGHLKFVGLMQSGSVGPGGSIPADTDPPVTSEGFAESTCLPDVAALSPSGGLDDLVGLAQTAYGLATTDWSNPAAALGAIGGLAGASGLGGLSQLAGLGSTAAGLLTTDWSNPGAAMNAAMGLAGSALGPSTQANASATQNGNERFRTTGGFSGGNPLSKGRSKTQSATPNSATGLDHRLASNKATDR